MKYLLMDTNIILDMIIDRRNNVTKELLISFIKLLDFNQIKLLVPSIIKHETHKHIEEQLLEVGKKITNAINAIDSIYGINGYSIEGLEVSEYKKKSKKHLSELKELYNKNIQNYLSEIQSLMCKLFMHRNSITIQDNYDLNQACLIRKIYKKAPFHIEKKDSAHCKMNLQ